MGRHLGNATACRCCGRLRSRKTGAAKVPTCHRCAAALGQVRRSAANAKRTLSVRSPEPIKETAG